MEDHLTEYKVSQGDLLMKIQIDLGRYLSSFANSSGGRILIGINDHGNYISITECQCHLTIKGQLLIIDLAT